MTLSLVLREPFWPLFHHYPELDTIALRGEKFVYCRLCVRRRILEDMELVLPPFLFMALTWGLIGLALARERVRLR